MIGQDKIKKYVAVLEQIVLCVHMCSECVWVRACVHACTCAWACVHACAGVGAWMCVWVCVCISICSREGVRTICSGLLRWDDLGEMLCFYFACTCMHIDIHILICLLARYCSLVKEKWLAMYRMKKILLALYVLVITPPGGIWLIYKHDPWGWEVPEGGGGSAYPDWRCYNWFLSCC